MIYYIHYTFSHLGVSLCVQVLSVHTAHVYLEINIKCLSKIISNLEILKLFNELLRLGKG